MGKVFNSCLCSLIVLMLGCSSSNKRVSSPEKSLYMEAAILLKHNQCEKALPKYKKYLNSYPFSKYSQRALFGQGYCLENRGDYREAIINYREVVNRNFAHHPKLTAEALVRLSYSYESLGVDSKVVASLKDALRRKKYLPLEVWSAEIPARLAAAYGRIGESLLARDYFIEAEKGLEEIRAKNIKTKKQMNQWLVQTLYYMGKMSDGGLDSERFRETVGTLSSLQIYLLRAMEKGIEPWSKMALDDLVETYSRLWDNLLLMSIENISDQDAARKSYEDRQRKRSLLLLESLQRLENDRLPRELEKGVEMTKLNIFVEGLKKRLNQLALSSLEDTRLTREALKHRGLKRGVRLLNQKIIFNEGDPNL